MNKKIDSKYFKGSVNYVQNDPFGKIKEIKDKHNFRHDPIQWLRDIQTRDEYRFSGFKPGKIYHFQYQPKYKDILSFYDRKPLIIFLKFKDPEHFYGYNLHFCSMKLREKIFSEFEQHNKNRNITSETAWTSLPTIQKFYPFILRMYIINRIQEKIYNIPQTVYDMENVKLFPSEYFFKKSSNEIFKLSMQHYLNSRL